MILGIFQNGIARKNPLVLVKIELLHTAYIFYIYIEFTDYIFTMEYTDIECTDYMFTMEYLDIECADYEDDILVLGEKSGNVSIYQLKNQVTWKGRQ